jgi:hypothetical protein
MRNKKRRGEKEVVKQDNRRSTEVMAIDNNFISKKRKESTMSKCKFLLLILAIAVFGWASGEALAQGKGTKAPAKGKVTINDVFEKFGKVTPAEQKAAAERAKQLGLKPGVAGRAAQAPAPRATR